MAVGIAWTFKVFTPRKHNSTIVQNIYYLREVHYEALAGTQSIEIAKNVTRFWFYAGSFFY